MRQPIELIQQESTSEQGTRIKAHELFAASLAAETCLAQRYTEILEEKDADEQKRQGRMKANRGPGVTDSPIFWCAQHNSTTTSYTTHWEKWQFLQIQTAKNAA